MNRKKFMMLVASLMAVLFFVILTAHLLSRDTLRSCTEFSQYVQKAQHLDYLRHRWSNPAERQRIMRKMTKIAPFRRTKRGEKYILEFENLSSGKLQNLVALIYRHSLKIDALEMMQSAKGKYTMKVKIAP